VGGSGGGGGDGDAIDFGDVDAIDFGSIDVGDVAAIQAGSHLSLSLSLSLSTFHYLFGFSQIALVQTRCFYVLFFYSEMVKNLVKANLKLSTFARPIPH
jgi:hypothetical protein